MTGPRQAGTKDTSIRIVAGAFLGFIIGTAFAYRNGQGEFAGWLLSGLVFALLIGLIVAILSWASNVAESKGYNRWVGILLVLILEVPGVIILLLLPARKENAGLGGP